MLFGKEYTSVKLAIDETMGARNAADLDALINKTGVEAIYPYLMIALYKNVTTLYTDLTQVPIETIVSTLTKLYPSRRYDWQPLVENKLSHNLNISKENWKHIELNLLLVQFKHFVTASKSKMVKVLADLIQSPDQFTQSYLPCMPHDEVYEIYQAVRASAGQNHNPTMYTCPNNHHYILENCGQAYVEHTCKECGAKIGGTNHVLLPTNKPYDNIDKTMMGYCLRSAQQLPDILQSMRELNTQRCHLLRFIIHACLYFSCDMSDMKGIIRILPNMQEPPNKKQFFWDHMLRDLKFVSKALNINTDEIMLLLHYIVEDMNNSIQVLPANADRLWSSQKSRQSWETQFAQTFLDKFIKNSATYINQATKALQDGNTSQDPNRADTKLYFMAYELLTVSKDKQLIVYENHDFWKYKPVVSLELLKMELQTTTEKDQFTVLKTFIEMQNVLVLLPVLMDVMKFVNYMLGSHSKWMFKHIIMQTSLRKAFQQKLFSAEWTEEKLERTVDAFNKIWIKSRDFLSQYSMSFSEFVLF